MAKDDDFFDGNCEICVTSTFLTNLCNFDFVTLSFSVKNVNFCTCYKKSSKLGYIFWPLFCQIPDNMGCCLLNK